MKRDLFFPCHDCLREETMIPKLSAIQIHNCIYIIIPSLSLSCKLSSPSTGQMLLCAQLLDSLLPCRETNCIAQDEDPQRHGTMPRVHQWHHSRSAFSMIFFESVAAFSFKRCYVMATVQQANQLLKNLYEAGMFQTLQNFFTVQETVRCSTQSRNLAERGLPEMAWQLCQLCHLCWLTVGIPCPNSEINK